MQAVKTERDRLVFDLSALLIAQAESGVISKDKAQAFYTATLAKLDQVYNTAFDKRMEYALSASVPRPGIMASNAGKAAQLAYLRKRIKAVG